MGKRRLLLNWCAAHQGLKQWVEEGCPDGGATLDNRKGWTYLTFFSPGTQGREILYDIDRIDREARGNGYYLPREVVAQHNKVVLTALPTDASPASPLPRLYSLVAALADRYADPGRYPRLAFYGKFGGIYDRPEKGRALALYSRDDEALLEIHDALNERLASVPAEGVRFHLRLTNGLSAIPRMLAGFDDPAYRNAGVTSYRIQDPSRFALFLAQARQDYQRYPFSVAASPGKG
jgi:hypothetical protein